MANQQMLYILRKSLTLFTATSMKVPLSGAVENPGEAKKLGVKNKQRVEEVFSWNNSIKDTVEVFERLTGS